MERQHFEGKKVGSLEKGATKWASYVENMKNYTNSLKILAYLYEFTHFPTAPELVRCVPDFKYILNLLGTRISKVLP